MKRKHVWLLNLLLLLASCRSAQPLIARPTTTEIPAASATATRTAKITATAQAHTAVATASAKVENWVMKFLPQRGPEAGFGVGVDEDTKRIEIIVHPKALAKMTDYPHLQTPEPVPQADWPPSLREALAGIDPSITVVLIPDIIIVTPTLPISGTVGP